MGRHDERWTIGDTRLTSLVAAETMGVPVVVDPCVGNGKHLTLPFWNELDLPWLRDFRTPVSS